MSNTSLLVESVKSLSFAAEEIDGVMTQYGQPYNELFSRYLSKNTEEKEAMVLALIAKVIIHKKMMSNRGK